MSGPSSRASNEANKAEQARQASIKNTQTSVNQVFDSPERAADISDYVGAMRTYYGDDLNRQKTVADRELKFSLARSGQTGGSTQNDQQAEKGRLYARGLLDIDRKAMGDGAELESADQDARARLISLATSGLDATTAATQSAAAMRSNLQAGRSTAQAQGIGDIFGSLKPVNDASKDAAARRKAIDDAYGRKGTYNTSGQFGYGGGT